MLFDVWSCVTPLLQHINRSNVLIVNSEELQNNPDTSLVRIFKFLGMPAATIAEFTHSSTAAAGNTTVIREAVLKNFPSKWAAINIF
jgi:hypothetical protein